MVLGNVEEKHRHKSLAKLHGLQAPDCGESGPADTGVQAVESPGRAPKCFGVHKQPQEAARPSPLRVTAGKCLRRARSPRAKYTAGDQAP